MVLKTRSYGNNDIYRKMLPSFNLISNLLDVRTACIKNIFITHFSKQK